MPSSGTAFAEGLHEAAHSRRCVPHRIEATTALLTAGRIISAKVFACGGVEVDSSARVLHMDGKPSPGLYAAGEIIGSHDGNYTCARSVLNCLVAGRQAGRMAASRRSNV
jgi:predicted oxidoreductase